LPLPSSTIPPPLSYNHSYLMLASSYLNIHSQLKQVDYQRQYQQHQITYGCGKAESW
jgi:hypothetical protein